MASWGMVCIMTGQNDHLMISEKSANGANEAAQNTHLPQVIEFLSSFMVHQILNMHHSWLRMREKRRKIIEIYRHYDSKAILGNIYSTWTVQDKWAAVQWQIHNESAIYEAPTFSLACFSSLPILSDGVRSPTMDSAMSCTRHNLMHLQKPKEWRSMEWSLPLDYSLNRQRLTFHGRGWAPTWQGKLRRPCGTCDLQHSRGQTPLSAPILYGLFAAMKEEKRMVSIWGT